MRSKLNPNGRALYFHDRVYILQAKHASSRSTGPSPTAVALHFVGRGRLAPVRVESGVARAWFGTTVVSQRPAPPNMGGSCVPERRGSGKKSVNLEESGEKEVSRSGLFGGFCQPEPVWANMGEFDFFY